MPSQRLAVALLLAAWVAPAAAQLSIEYPKAPIIEPAKTDKEEAAEKEAEKIVYSGDPVVVAPPCEPKLLNAAFLQCSAAAPCEMTVEVLGAAEAGERLWVFGDIRTPSATASSFLLLSEDGGETWTPPHAPIPGAVLETAEIEDAEHGFLAGHQETGGAAKQPFFLATRDGGLFWRKWDIAAGQEERGGVIIDYRFDGPEHGFVILERLSTESDPFELYETYNGARSWSIRQISPNQPRMPGSRRLPTVSEWRIDETDGVYAVVRKRTGAVVGRFAAAIGVCPGPASD